MKLTSLAFAATGYVLGAKAGRDRYDQIVRVARRVAGSQTVQSTAGVVHGQLDHLTAGVRQALAGRFAAPARPPADSGVNGYHH